MGECYLGGAGGKNYQRIVVNGNGSGASLYQAFAGIIGSPKTISIYPLPTVNYFSPNQTVQISEISGPLSAGGNWTYKRGDYSSYTDTYTFASGTLTLHANDYWSYPQYVAIIET